MSYEKRTWSTGEIITADKLNHMEDGIANSGSGSGGTSTNILIVTFTGSGSTYTCDKTYEEILNAIDNGDVVIGRCSNYGCIQVYKQMNGGTQKYEIQFYLGFISKTNVAKLSIYNFVIASDNTVTYENMGYVG